MVKPHLYKMRLLSNLIIIMSENRSKFNVSMDKSRRQSGDYHFDSELEKRFYDEIVLPGLENGTITECVLQKPFELLPEFIHGDIKISSVIYYADFYLEYIENGETKKIVIDTKGYPRPDAILKRKMFWYKYPDLRYEWIAYSKIDGGWIKYDDLVKRRAMRKRLKNKGFNGVKYEKEN